MNIYTGERGSGKTRALILNTLVDANAILCVPSQQQRNEIVRRYPELNRRVVTHNDALGRSDVLRGRMGALLIDELGVLLREVVERRFSIGAISESGKVIRL